MALLCCGAIAESNFNNNLILAFEIAEDLLSLYQTVEEEAGSAEEQPASNRLSRQAVKVGRVGYSGPFVYG